MKAQVPREHKHSSNNHSYDAYAKSIRVQSPLVVLPITVTDPAGNFVLGESSTNTGRPGLCRITSKRFAGSPIQKIAVEVNSEYTLTYVPNTLNKTGSHPIRVEVSKAGLRVHTRAGYFYGPTLK